MVQVTEAPVASAELVQVTIPTLFTHADEDGSLSPDLAGPAPGPLLNRGLPSPDGIWGKESLWW